MNTSVYRIAFFLPKLIKSAPIIYYKNLIDFLIIKFDITIFYFKGIDEIGFNCKTIKINFRDKPDFNNFNLVQSFGFVPDFFLAYNRKRIKVPIVSTIHSYVFFDLKSQFNFLFSYILGLFWIFNLNKFDKLVCLTKNMEDYYRYFFKSMKLTYIYSGHSVDTKYLLDSQELDVITSFKSDKILLGIFANATYQKGIDHVIKFISLSDKYNLLIIGDGKYLNKLKNLAQKFNVDKNCLFLGHKDHAHKYFRVIDIYVLSSYQEGFGLVGLESSIYKIPIVCNDIPVFREIYDENSVCFYNCFDSESFLSALELSFEKRMYFSEKIAEYSRRKYTLDLMRLKYQDLYLSMIQRYISKK